MSDTAIQTPLLLMYTQKTQIQDWDVVFFGFCVYIVLMNNKRRGRPPKGSSQAKTIRLDMRLNEAEKEGFIAAAELSGLDLSAWIRERLRWAATKELQEASRPVPFIPSIGE